MKKPLKITLAIVGALVAIPVLLLTTTAVVNVVATDAEASEIVSYGQRVPVDGREMNVVISGEGAETIVLLPGLGTAAPGLDFRPLIDELDDEYRVVAVEPFGTGLSDQTDVPRTSENITREVHEALSSLGIDRYVLMGHSIAGIYALPYSAAYRDELVAFVGIDSSVPDQPGSDEPIPTGSIAALSALGITRALTAIAPNPYEGLPYDAETVEQMALLTTKNAAAPTMIDEMDHVASNFASVSGSSFPADLPVLLFARATDTDVAGWVDLHREQAASVDRGELVLLEGDHYLHHTRATEIRRATDAFLAPLAP